MISTETRQHAAVELALLPGRPLHIVHLAGGLTLAVTSVAWLRERGPAARLALEERHLCAEEAEQLHRLPVPKRRLEWLAGRFAAKHAVCAHRRRHDGVAMATREVRLGADRHGLRAGKPYVNAPVGIGITHSADFAVAVCGPHTVGVDLERSRPMGEHFAQLLAVAAAGGDGPRRRRLEAMPLPLRWACKEAVLKAYGFGLRFDPREVELTDWHPDGSYTWRTGPRLARYAPRPGGCRYGAWAREIDGYAMALVWR